MQEFLTSFVADISVYTLIQYLVIGTVYAFILGFVAKKYSKIIGNKAQYLIIFPLLIPTMILIISIIKSSLALSLGLVGALSIIRFRTPIKEPEELCYLFVAIAVGLGLGAGQVVSTSVCFFFLVIIMVILGYFKKNKEPQGVFLDIDSVIDSEPINLSVFSSVLQDKKIPFELRRYENDGNNVSATYYIEPESVTLLEEVLEKFRNIAKDTRLTVINKVNLLD